MPDFQSLIVNRHGWGIADKLLSVARTELLLLVPKVRILGELLNLGEGEVLLGQEIVNALCIVGRDVVDLGKVLLLIGR